MYAHKRRTMYLLVLKTGAITLFNRIYPQKVISGLYQVDKVLLIKAG
jgi:hypothetical protein